MHSSLRSSLLVVALPVALVTSTACTGATDTELDDSAPPATGAVTFPNDPAAPSPAAPSAGGASTPSMVPSDPGKGDSDPSTDPNAAPDTVLCDTGLALASADPFDAAKAIGLCKQASPASAGASSGWGVVEAKLTKPDGTPIASPLSWGLLTTLGTQKAPSGNVMLALSTGTARGPNDPGFQSPIDGFDKGYTHPTPPGQPKVSSVCSASDPKPTEAHDGVALVLKIRVPSTAKSMSFTHQLFTADTGDSMCSQYNDAFVVLMDPKPAGTNGNIVVDNLGDPVGINSASLLRACTPGTYKGIAFACPLGTSSLAGTGFDGKSATGWLRTTVPVTAGSEITLRFAIWDSGDGILDSTVLIDELAFSTQAATGVHTVAR
jgi:hypothetical protein